MDFLAHIPWWLIAGAAAAATFFIWRYLGLRVAIGAAVSMLLYVIHHRGRQQGWEAREQKGKEESYEAVKEANEARRDADLRNADPERLRESDGYRRD